MSISGATTEGIKTHLNRTLEKKPDKMVLHVETKDLQSILSFARSNRKNNNEHGKTHL
jgi:hypothetical protein